MRRRLGCLLSALLAVGLAAGHLGFWYAPRERPGVPDPEDEPGRLLKDPSFDLALWLPYPHQNLARLEAALGGRRATAEWLAAVLRLAGVDRDEVARTDELSIPSFGPFALPPARELTLALDLKREPGRSVGRRTALAVRIYPALATIGRMAGAVAGNPWLAGGEVRAFGGPARVSWQGGLWTVARGADGEARGEGSEGILAHRRPALARLRLGPGSGSREMPAGSYRLGRPAEAREGFELILEGGAPRGDSDPLEPWLERLPAAGVTAVWAEPDGVTLLFDGDGNGDTLPPAAVLAAGGEGSRRPRLVHERLPSLLRGELELGTAGRWKVLATGGETLRAARELAAGLPPPEALPDRLLWVDLPALRSFVGDVVRLMEEVPLFPRQELQRWRDLRTALAPLEGFRRLVLLSCGEAAPRGRFWQLRVTPAVPLLSSQD